MLKETKDYLRYYANTKGTIALSFFLSLVQTVSLVPVAMLVQNVFDRALPQRNTHALVLDLCAMLALLCANALAVLWNRHVSLGIIKSTVASMRTRLLDRAMRLGKEQYAVGDLESMHSKIVHDTERIDCMTSALLTQFLPGVLVVAGLSCVLAYVNWRLFLVVAGVLPLLYIAGKIFGRRVKESIRRFHADFSTFSKGALFVLKFGELIQLSTAERVELSRQESHVQDLRFSSKRMALLSTAYTIIQSNMLMITGIVVLFVGGEQVVHGVTTVGSLLSFYIALNLMSSNAKNAITAVPVIVEGRESLGVVMPLVDGLDPLSVAERGSFASMSEGLTFEGVHFAHADSPFALSDIGFEVKKGTVFGIFGPSGSGKSTLINLLLGFYEPSLGAIHIDGRPATAAELAGYRDRIGVLSQDPLIFPGTIRENLTYGLSGVDDARIAAACTAALIHDYVLTLEKGYDSTVGERGVRLSGGQRQRIAIARALLRDPEILILDEPDNNLDEAMFMEILRRIKSLPLTAIIISHNRNLRPHLDGSYELT